MFPTTTANGIGRVDKGGTSNYLHYRKDCLHPPDNGLGLSRKQTQTPNHRPPVPGFDTSPHVAVK